MVHIVVLWVTKARNVAIFHRNLLRPSPELNSYHEAVTT
jgi:hypothetical protein